MAFPEVLTLYTLTLINNFIVMVGAISFLYWLQSTTATSFVVTHEKPLLYIMDVGFLGFLCTWVWATVHFEHILPGMYLPQLHMIIVTSYLISLHRPMRWWWVVDGAAIAFCYLALGTPLSVVSVGALAVAGVTLHLVGTAVANHQWSPLRVYSGLVVFGGALLVSLLSARGLDLAQWAQQGAALVILGWLCLAFDQIMDATRVRTDKMHSLTTIDELTGVHNFSTFSKELDRLFEQFQKDGEPYCVFEGDLDHFKQINDTYGHLAGNAVLRQLALELDAFADAMPYPATAYRLGGEEFAIIAHAQVNHEEAMAIGDRYLELLKLVRFPGADPNLVITCSIGQARVEHGDYSANDVYKKADRAELFLIIIMALFGTPPLFTITAVFIALILAVKVVVNHQYPRGLRVVLVLTYILLMVVQLVFFALNLRPDFTWRGTPMRFVATLLLLVPFLVEFIVTRSNNDRFYLPSLGQVATISFAEFKENEGRLREAVAGIDRVRHVLAVRNVKAILSDIHRHSVARYINEGSLDRDYFHRADATLADPNLYIVISNTGSPASELISLFTQKQFNHASLSFDADLTTIISYNGGESVYPPGLNAEMVTSFHKKSDAAVLVYRLPVTPEQKRRVIDTVREINLTGSAYNILGLVTKRSLRQNIMFCSQFVYKMLQVGDVAYFDKQPGDVRPTDFVELDYRRKLAFVTEIKF